MGRVEFRMLLLIDLINEAPLEGLFDEHSGQTFGDKIKIFKKWCDFGGVPDEHKSTLQCIYKELEDLRPMRNFLVHGETWEGAFRSKPPQPYRVGLVKEILEYLDEFERADTVRTCTTSSRYVMQQDVPRHYGVADAIAATAVPLEEDYGRPVIKCVTSEEKCLFLTTHFSQNCANTRIARDDFLSNPQKRSVSVWSCAIVAECH